MRSDRLRGAGEGIDRLLREQTVSPEELNKLLGWPKGKLTRIRHNRQGLTAQDMFQIGDALRLPKGQVLSVCFKAKVPDFEATRLGQVVGKLLETMDTDDTKRACKDAAHWLRALEAQLLDDLQRRKGIDFSQLLPDE